MNNTNIILWLSGAVTTASLVVACAVVLANARLRRRLPAAPLPNKASATPGATAAWIWNGWSNPGIPSKVWAVTVKLKVVESSLSKPGVHRFVLVSHFSPEPSDPWRDRPRMYKDYFIKKYNGGWLDTNNLKDFHWTYTQDARSKKIDWLFSD
jgi:hypothetical protein